MMVSATGTLGGGPRKPTARGGMDRALGVLLVVAAIGAPAWAQVASELRFGGDAEGGAPFVEADPQDPARVQGFEVDIASLLAGELGRVPRFVQVSFTSLDAATARGDFDIALSGIEDTPARRARLAVTVPYYMFREVLTVRVSDAARYRTLGDLAGRRVATLGATLAFDILQREAAARGTTVVAYEDDVHPYTDLALGRVDAVLLDAVLAARGVRRNPGLVNAETPVATGHYVGLLAPDSPLLAPVNGVLRAAMSDGRAEAIFRKWGMWNDDQVRLYASVQGQGEPGGPDIPPSAADGMPVWRATTRYLPALLRAALVTLVLSCVSMALAVAIGVVVASGRVYGAPPVRAALTAWVELVRGTP